MYPRAKYLEDKEEWENLPDPVASVKHDGANFFMTVGEDGSLRYFSRRPSVKGGFPERTAQLPHLTDKKLPQYAGNVYNIELVHTGHSSGGREDHPKLSGILNSLPEKSIKSQEEEGPVRAILLNVIHPKINTYGEKLEHMQDVANAFHKPEILKPVSVKIGRDNIHALIDSTKKMGQEGVIVTSLTKPENENVRVKVKHVNTWNLKISRINQEYDIQGNPKESAGSVTVVDSTGREVADVGTGFSRDLRKEIWDNPKKWINKPIQVKARNPSRNKLLAPVYNGESDGSMDKVAETLEDRLLFNLTSRYQEKGINPQKILDNPLFQALPLDKKISFIEQANPILSQKPKFELKNIGVGAIGGGISGAIAAAMYRSLHGGSPGTLLPTVAAGAVLGGILGTTGGAIRSLQDKARDMATAKALPSGSLETLITRTSSSPIGKSPFGLNKYLDFIEQSVDKSVGPVSYTIGAI